MIHPLYDVIFSVTRGIPGLRGSQSGCLASGKSEWGSGEGSEVHEEVWERVKGM